MPHLDYCTFQMYSLHNILLQLKSPWHFLGLLLPKIPAHLPWGYDGWTISLWNSMNFNRTIKKHVWGAQLCLSLLNNLENFFLVDIFLIVWQGWTCYRNRHVTFWVIHPLSQCLAEVIFFFLLCHHNFGVCVHVCVENGHEVTCKVELYQEALAQGLL